MCLLPILARQLNTHECIPPVKKTYFLFFETPTQKSPNVIKTFNKCASFSQQISKPETFKINNLEKSENDQNTVLSIFTWHHFCAPILWNPIFVMRKRGGHLINSQVDT